LWAADPQSGQRRRLLPDFQMEHYNVSYDGRRVVFVSASVYAYQKLSAQRNIFQVPVP
jgi:hypothetical protein